MLHALGVDRVALLSNNPDKAEQLGRLGVDGDRAGADRGAPLRRQPPYLATKAGRGSHTLELGA